MEGKEVKMIQSCANCMNDKPFFGGNCGDCVNFSKWELKDCLPCIEQWGEQIRIYEHQIEILQEQVEQLKNSKFEKNEKMSTKPEDPYYKERYLKLENASTALIVEIDKVLKTNTLFFFIAFPFHSFNLFKLLYLVKK